MLRVGSLFSGGFGSNIFALKYEGIEYEDVFAVDSIDINTMRRLISAMIRHIDGVKLNPIEAVKFEKAKVQCSLLEEKE